MLYLSSVMRVLTGFISRYSPSSFWVAAFITRQVPTTSTNCTKARCMHIYCEIVKIIHISVIELVGSPQWAGFRVVDGPDLRVRQWRGQHKCRALLIGRRDRDKVVPEEVHQCVGEQPVPLALLDNRVDAVAGERILTVSPAKRCSND